MKRPVRQLKAFRLEKNLLEEVARAASGFIKSETDQVRAMLLQGVESFSNSGLRLHDESLVQLGAEITRRRVMALMASLEKFIESKDSASSHQWFPERVLAQTIEILDMRGRALLHHSSILVAQGRALLGTHLSQRLLTDSPEVMAFLVWRHGMSPDIEALAANTRLYGILDALAVPVSQPLQSALSPKLNRYILRAQGPVELGSIASWLGVARNLPGVSVSEAEGSCVRLSVDVNERAALLRHTRGLGCSGVRFQVDFDALAKAGTQHSAASV